MTPLIADNLCDELDCGRPVHSRARYCSAHAKQLQRKGTTGPLKEHLTLRERCLDKAIALADVDTQDDSAFERAWDALEHALKDWERSMRQRRAAKARWADTTAAERSEMMRTVVLARWHTSQARMAGKRYTPKGKRRARKRD